MTLIELVVVMVLVALLLGIGIPSFKSVTTSSRISGESNALLGDLQYARSEAVREGSPVTVCVSKTGTSCDNASDTWQEGWIVFSDVNDDQTVDPGDTVLRVQSPFPSTDPDSFTSPAGDYAVTFTREGFAYTGAGGMIVTLHNEPDNTYNSYYTRCVELSQAGMMSVQSHSTDAAGCT